MNYYLFEKSPEGYIYSCDKLSLIGKLHYLENDTFASEISDFLLLKYSSAISDTNALPWDFNQLSDYAHYERIGKSEFRHNISIKLSNGSSFYFGFAHNSSLSNSKTWKMELNPNKCLPCEFVIDFINFVVGRSKLSSIRISQMDLAIDFPLSRNSFYLVRDKRRSTVVNDGSDNITEYLSKHNSHGFVKLYNKRIESKLDYDLTRLEITLKEFDLKSVLSVFPKVHVYDMSQITIDEVREPLTVNDTVFLELLRMHPEYLKKLTYRKQQTFNPYLNFDAPLYQLNADCYLRLYENIKAVFLCH